MVPTSEPTSPSSSTRSGAVRSGLALSRLALALLVAALSGVLLAALAFPVVGGIGLATKAAADDFQALPSGIATPSLSLRSRVLAADGSLLATFYRVNRIEAPFDTIPKSMRNAVVAIEDSRFYEHEGVDYQGTLRAAVTNARSGAVVQGGSTLTQQYVKNALIEAAAGDEAGQAAAIDRSVERKLREARYALALERTMSKDEILHGYLEIAYFGNGVYGVGTAAQYYFDRPVSKLTLAQSATLAGVVQNPRRFDVASKDRDVRAGVVERRNVVLSRMRDLGHISEAAHRKAAASRLGKIETSKVESGCEAASVAAPFFCEHVRRELEGTEVGAALGATREERQTALFGGGLTIRTTLDPVVQRATQKGLYAEVPRDDPSKLHAAADVVEPGTGHIRAMAVNRPYGDGKRETKVNFATGGSAGFQPGSTFKVFYLAEAIRQGLPLSTSYYSPAEYLPDQDKCPTKEDGVVKRISNAEEDEAGTFDLVSGTHLSVNTFYVQLAERLGFEKPMALAESMGLRKTTPQGLEPLPQYCSSVLGSLEVSPLALAGAYATFAASGIHCTPRAVLSITDRAGKELPVPETECGRVLEAGVADKVTSVLRGVVDGTSNRTGRAAALGRPVAGKTGTTNESRAAWFVGYTPQLASAVWVGLPTPTPLRNIRINGTTYRQVYGGTVPAKIFARAMRGAHEALPVEQFPPGAAMARASSVRLAAVGGKPVPDVSGGSYANALARLQAAGLRPTAGRLVTSPLPAGVVAYTFPRAGQAVAPGATVYVYRSTGRAVIAPSRSRRPTAEPKPRPKDDRPKDKDEDKPKSEPKPKPGSTPPPPKGD